MSAKLFRNFILLVPLLISTLSFGEGYSRYPGYGAPNWRASVSTLGSLPASGNNVGDAIAAQDTGVVYIWTGSSWTASGGGGGGSGVTTVGAFSGSAQTNGASISSTTITFGPASATVPGMVSTGAQTWAGVKTLSSAPVFSSITNTGTLTLPTSTDTLVGRATSDTLTNKTLSAAIVSGSLKSGNCNLQACITAAGNSGTAQTLDLSTCTIQTSTLTGNVTYTLSNPQAGCSYLAEISTGAGGFTVTWPGTVLWSQGTAPIITVSASKRDLIWLTYDGSNYFGTYSQNY